MIARLDADGLQAGGGAVHHGAEFGVAGAFAEEVERRAAGEAADRVVEYVNGGDGREILCRAETVHCFLLRRHAPILPLTY